MTEIILQLIRCVFCLSQFYLFSFTFCLRRMLIQLLSSTLLFNILFTLSSISEVICFSTCFLAVIRNNTTPYRWGCKFFSLSCSFIPCIPVIEQDVCIYRHLHWYSGRVMRWRCMHVFAKPDVILPHEPMAHSWWLLECTRFCRRDLSDVAYCMFKTAWSSWQTVLDPGAGSVLFKGFGVLWDNPLCSLSSSGSSKTPCDRAAALQGCGSGAVQEERGLADVQLVA